MTTNVVSRTDQLVVAILVWVLATTVMGVLLVWLGVFNAFVAMGAGVAVLIVFWSRYSSSLSVQGLSGWMLGVLGFLLVFALALRLEPSQYTLGGQDEGFYVLISQQYLHHGGNFYTDRVRGAIDDPDLLEYYDTYNQRVRPNPSGPWYKEGKYEGVHYLGLYIANLKNNRYVFQFYPVQSIWVAIFSAVFGSPNGVWCTVFFGVLSVALAFYLVLELTGSGLAGLVTAALFAVNALHAFFSKFPVSEIVALSLFLTSLLFLARYMNRQSAISLVLSGVAWSCYFFARISAFVALPFILGIVALSLIYLSADQRAKGLTIYSVLTLAGYGLSLAYGYTQTYPYFRDIFVNSVGRTLGADWQLKLVLGLMLSVVILVLMRIFSRGLIPIMDRLSRYKSVFLVVLLSAVTCIALYRLYEFSFTPTYEHLRGANQGAASFGFSTLYVFGLFLTVPGIILLIWGVWSVMKRNSLFDASLLLLFLLFWAYIAVVMMITPYLYYYARYQVSELIPLALILIGVGFRGRSSPAVDQ